MQTRIMLTAGDTATIVSAARAEAQRRDWSVAIAIVDDAGFLLHFERMDGAGPMTAEVSIGKAKASAVSRRPTKELEARVLERPGFLAYFQLDKVPIQGALPILIGEQCVGAVGVSGRQSAEDEELARIGIAALSAE